LKSTAATGNERSVEVLVRDGRLPDAEVIDRIASSVQSLRSIVLLFGGSFDQRCVESALALYRRSQNRGDTFSADFTLDHQADACAALDGRQTSLLPVLQLSRTLRQHGVPVRWRIPALAALVYRLESLFSLAADENVDAVLVHGPRFGAELDDDCRRFLSDFIAIRLLEEERDRLSQPRAAFYEAMLAALRDRRLELPAPGEPIVVLEPDDRGQWLPRAGERRPATSVLDAANGRSEKRSNEGSARAADVAEVLGEGCRAIGQWLRTALAGKARSQRTAGAVSALPRVLVIGAYGGDHIGDTAIVGGVLLRMHHRYRTNTAIIVSQRADHTRRLVQMLDVPVRVSVEEYRQTTVAKLLKEVDAVVFGGGPLMDLPKQLVKHLYTVGLARRAGKPFVVEGIGAGPFIRRASAWTARLLVLMAERITVRTAADAGKPLVRDLEPVVGQDPAFDYLATRGAELTRLPSSDRRSIHQLFEDTDGRITIGINLRPLRPDYTVGAPPAERARHTQFVEARFEQRLAEAMKRFHQASTQPPCFIFFPMNSIQFGSSDLRSAYRIKRLVGREVDLRIWEADPSIDGVIALLRRVDVAITMRFHATIYALSQKAPVIGVDYRPGKRDKVSALLSDAGQGDNCGLIDEITADWLFERLVALTGRESLISNR
jgi:polysaccharide pyruvyl transferase WcaK-like protein